MLDREAGDPRPLAREERQVNDTHDPPASMAPRAFIGGSTGPPGDGAAHAWERWLPLWHVAFYVLLAVATVAALVDPDVSWGRRAALVGLAAVLAGWYRGMAVAGGTAEQEVRPALRYLAGLLPLFAGLTALHPAFMLLAFALYWQVYSFLPLRWAIPGSIAITLLLWWRTVALSGRSVRPDAPMVTIFVVSVACGTLLAFYIDAIIRQSHDRQRLIGELAAAQEGLAVAERQAGVLAERQRLAHEIHDTLAQGFTSIVVHLEAAEAALPVDQATTQRHLDQARGAARANLAEARRLVRALRPEALEYSSLPNALKRLAARWSVEAGVAAEAVVGGAPRPLPPEVEITLLRVGQEALANVRKHARAGRVALMLWYGNHLITLDVRDDGVGFDPIAPAPATDGGGFGLTAMRERIEGLGGTLVVASEPGGGTVITATLPTCAGVAVGAA